MAAKLGRDGKPRRRPSKVLSREEVELLLGSCSPKLPTGIRDRALMAIMHASGLRVEEALSLHVADIDLKRRTVQVLHGKWDRDRTVGIGNGDIAMIQLWIDKRAQLGLSQKSTPLFCKLNGKPLSDRAVRYMVKRRAARAGIERDVHPHMLRHAFASELAEEGNPVNVIQKALGHAHLTTTAIYLDHIQPMDVIKATRDRRTGAS
jgi:integrase/recombinase XerD